MLHRVPPRLCLPTGRCQLRSPERDAIWRIASSCGNLSCVLIARGKLQRLRGFQAPTGKVPKRNTLWGRARLRQALPEFRVPPA